MRLVQGFRQYSIGKSNYISHPTFKSSEDTENERFLAKLDSITNDRDALVFIKDKQNLETIVGKDGSTPIHKIAKSGFYESMKQLLLNPKKAKIYMELRDFEGRTPLAVANDAKMARFMVLKGANLYALDNNQNPAGANPALPNEIREKVLEFVKQKKEEKQASIVIVEQTSQAETVLSEGEKSPVPALKSDLAQEINTAAAVTNYAENSSKEEEEVNKDIKENKDSKNYFGMFKKKATPLPIENNNEIKEEFPAVNQIEIPNTDGYIRIESPDFQSLDDVVGNDNIKQALRSGIVEPVKNKKYRDGLKRNKTSIPNGVLIVAPPGNGKTSLVKALGAEASMPVFELPSLNDLKPLMSAIQKNFDKTSQRAIIYIRGIDNIYGQQDGNITNQLNRELEGSAKKGVLVVMSAENSENIPKTILTPGKIDRIFSFKTPDNKARALYLRKYFENKEILKGINNDDTIKLLAEKTQGFSIAQLKHIIDESVLSSTTEGNTEVTLDKLLDRIKIFSKEQNIPEINEYNNTSMYDTVLRRYQPSEFDAENFESIAGMESTKNSVENNILKPWRNADKLRAARIQLPTGGIFSGDPGTSKTYIAKSISRSLGLPLYTLKMSEISSSYVHETSQNIGRIVNQLVNKFDETGEGSVLLLDEIDYFQKGQSQSGTEEVNTLLQEIERGRNKILFIGTTNELECLPDSLTRDGRMGAVIHFEHCDKKAARAIIVNMLKQRMSNPQVKQVLANNELLDKISECCSGMVASSVSEIVNDALSETVIEDINLDEAIIKAVNVRKKKEIEKILSKNSKNVGHRLNITEDSTIMYDTKYSRLLPADNEPKSLDDLGGMKEVKSILREEIIDAYEPETLALLKENGLPISKGFILHGPPGNGKTTIIKALANEMKLPLYPLNSGNVGSSYIHELSKNAQQLREQLAYKYKMTGERSVVIMDEAQQLIPKTSGSAYAHSHNIEETNFFKEMIMSAEQDGIIYAMATNDLNQIEPAFYENSDRLSVCVYVDNPDYESRVGVIKKLVSSKPIAKNINNDESISTLATLTAGLSIAKISQLILNAVRNGIKTKTPITLDNTIELIKKGGKYIVEDIETVALKHGGKI